MANDDNQYQRRYWQELVQLNTHLRYVNEYLGESQRRDRIVNGFLAVTSNGSICGWAIWSQLGPLWGVIIALSQLVNAVKSFLPYQQRIGKLIDTATELRALALQAENEWYGVAEGRLSEEEIHRLVMKIKRKKLESVGRHLTKITLPEKANLLEKASADTEKYFRSFYGA